jgi:signal peptidase I
LRVLRDVYYRAVHADSDGDSEYASGQYRSPDDIDAILSQPSKWKATDLFSSRRTATFYLGPDQFFPLGDNSPQSKDARLWSSRSYLGEAPEPPPYVERDLLIGRALAIYWPHGWRIHAEGLGIIPNFQRISLIR